MNTPMHLFRFRFRFRKRWGLCIGASTAIFTTFLVLIYREIPARQDLAGRANARDISACDRSLYPSSWELPADQVTVLMNGFSESRLHLLAEHAQAMSASTVVHSVYILWGNTSTPQTILDKTDWESLGAPIRILRQPSTSLNDRFLPRPFFKTRAVIVCDDDVSIDLKSLSFAVQVWKENQGRIVGFFPRSHVYQLEQNTWIYTKQPDRYSIMLTKFMIVATEFLYLYTCRMPAPVRDYVDEGLNCEDIAMNFLVSNYTGQGPLLVQGRLQDRGDTRNTDADDFGAVALSSRSGHRKDRGQCITAFHRAWGRMTLKYSYFKAVADVREPALCDKFGLAIDCDSSVSSKREALRHLGGNVLTTHLRLAYVTVVTSEQAINASLRLGKSLKDTGTAYDIVLLLAGEVNTDLDEELWEEYFDEVKFLGNRLDDKMATLNVWLMTDYSKLVLMDANSLVLANLDHLFELPEIAAVPDYEKPGRFDTRLLLVRPSNETYHELLEFLMQQEDAMTLDEYLNTFFSDWFFLPTEHRLPSRYSVPTNIEIRPLGFDSASTYKRIGEPLVIPGYNDSLNTYSTSRRPSATRRYSRQMRIAVTASNEQKQEVFVTVLWDDQQTECISVWLASFRARHPNSDTVLLVLSSLNREKWQPFAEQFDAVEVVETPNARDPTFAMVHLWNQTQYRKLVYLDVCSIFLQACHSFFDFEGPLAAVPSFIPADSFSSSLMVLKPCHKTFKRLTTRLEDGTELGVEALVNDVLGDLYAGAAQRIHPSLVEDMRVGKATVEDSYRRRVLAFSLAAPIWSSSTRWGSHERESVRRAWLDTASKMKLALD